MHVVKKNWKSFLGGLIWLLDCLARVEFVTSHLANKTWIADKIVFLNENPLYLGLIGLLFIAWDILQRRNKGSIGQVLIGAGGAGGTAKVIGNNSGAAGGDGGEGGIGPGGKGGDAEVIGDNSFVRGGDGGNAGQHDGRGGRRTRGPAEKLNLASELWKFGYGGAGPNNPEYDRRLHLLVQIRKEYALTFPDDVPFIEAGIDQVPANWVNKRLEELGERWRVGMSNGGYVLPPLTDA